MSWSEQFSQLDSDGQIVVIIGLLFGSALILLWGSILIEGIRNYIKGVEKINE